MTVLAQDHLRLSDFDFTLPQELIAQEPAEKRDASRLMVLRRASDDLEHRVFSDLPSCLVSGDLLVLNNTKVFPCRLSAVKPGGGKAEIFLLAERERNLWKALVKGRLKPGTVLQIGPGVEAEIIGEQENGTRTVRFHCEDDVRSLLQRLGKVPLPPYIARDASARDRERYQTVYASQEGAVAAPTAGLHFSSELLSSLAQKGVEVVTITLHVGPGTFQPVRAELITEHRMMAERYEVSPEAAAAVNCAKRDGRRVIAVGTTSVRTIESAATADGIAAGAGQSELFIYPGFRFRITDGLITNFHLPKSTLLMLVSAFGGREWILSAYRAAIEERYRFYSYGDAMFII